MKDDNKIEQELAWIGDAVLGLFARNWILEKERKMDAEMFTRMTSNIFLNSLGNPTKVEAKIGLIFNNDGLEKAFIHIEKSILPLFMKQEKKRIRQAGGIKL
ncbi:ribonuclease III domain-containing protein [Verrucomicrobiales bacterium]|nr:ribonuclease III domain-containing protein [Verrucomicrobiales bacterium]